MFCSKCGYKMETPSKFCPICGTPTGLDTNADASAQAPAAEQAPVVEQAAAAEQAPVAEQTPVAEQAPAMDAPVFAQAPAANGQPMMAGAMGAPMMAAPKVKKPLPKWLIPAIAGGVALIGIIIAVIFIVVNQPKKVNLTKYILARYTGFNGNGEARFELDYDKLTADGYIPSMDKLSLGDVKTYINLEAAYTAVELTPDKSSGLSNGDEIVVTITYNNKLAKKNKQKFTGKTAKFTVEGLSDIAIVDPFDGLTVTFSGINGSGYLSYDYDYRLSELGYYSFYYDKYSELSNGDTVTFTVDYNEDYVTKSYGRAYSTTTKTFTVSGLTSYMDSLSDLSDSDLTALTTTAKDYLLQYISENYDSCNTVSDLKELGTVSFRNNDPTSWSTQQYTYFFYSGMVSCSNNDFVPTLVFYPVCISNIELGEGTIQAYTEPYIQDSCYIPGTWAYTKGCIDLYQFLRSYCTNDSYTITCTGLMAQMMNRDKVLSASQFSESSLDRLVNDALSNLQAKDNSEDAYEYTDITYVGNSLGNRIEMEDCSVSDEHKMYLYFTAVASDSENAKPLYFSIELEGVNMLPDGTLYYTELKLNGWTNYWSWTSGYGYENVEEMFARTVGEDLDCYNFEYNNDLVPETYLNPSVEDETGDEGLEEGSEEELDIPIDFQ